MSEDTVTTQNGIELDAEDLEEALDQVTEDGDSVEDDWAVVGSVVVSGDGYNDHDIYVANLEDVTQIDSGSLHAEEKWFTNVQRVRQRVEDSTEDDFAAFVEREFRDATVVEADETAFDTHNTDLDITTSQHRDVVGSRTARGLDDSDDVEVQYIAYGRNGGAHGALQADDTQDEEDRELIIGLTDKRDE